MPDVPGKAIKCILPLELTLYRILNNLKTLVTEESRLYSSYVLKGYCGSHLSDLGDGISKEEKWVPPFLCLVKVFTNQAW